MNDRTCIVTRKSGSSEEMIRFVAGPDKHIVPDLKAVLPGRGAWVLASRPVIEEAIKRKAFARSLKADVIVEDKLVDLVDRLLVKAALGNLAMARKAGAVIFGSTKVESAIRSHQVRLVLHAKEAAYDGVRKIDQAIHAAKTSSGKDVSVLSLFTSDEMGVAFGDNHVIHAALLNVQAAEGFIKTAHKLVAYRGGKRNEPEETTVEAVKETE
ncbi:MAG: RNA-binding protein [Bartonella sp.]|nr:RNA-binding protein [Bartonella sp.]